MPKRMIFGSILAVVGVILTFCSYSLPVEKHFWQKIGCLLVVTGVFLAPNWINKEE
ncbi:hypothetical protein [Bacillus sp. FJAT-42315]|uniref:hypothetical protein n=1 Tax=Bacillus sp. FJAT-42315 TaxID=2014077 RepID=UPI0012FF2798|nr:hypothetical protein [Bacillus sp. FJAT-42315]